MAALLPAKDTPRLITRKEVAALLGVHVETVKRYTRAGLLKPVKFTRAVRYPEAEVLHFMQNGVRPLRPYISKADFAKAAQGNINTLKPCRAKGGNHAARIR
jgi:excisionase family DNA binding protein